MSANNARRTHIEDEDAYWDADDEDISSPTVNAKEVERKWRARAAAALGTSRSDASEGDLERTTPIISAIYPKDSSEVDPLEEYMDTLHASLRAETNADTSNNGPVERGEQLLENADFLADFLEEATRKAAGDAARAEQEKLDDSDSEKKEGQPLLPLVDHSLVDYRPLKKNIYKEDPAVASLSVEERAAEREKLSIAVAGYKVPHFVKSFDLLKCSLEPRLLHNISLFGWGKPTVVQSQLIPILLSGRDALAIAETGSGKTAAFLVPAVQIVCKTLDAWKLAAMPPEEGPIAMIVCPTRELAFQTHITALKLVDALRLRVSCFAGGYEKTQQFKEIKRGIELCIGTPGRLIDLSLMKGGLSLKYAVLLVLDEADRLLDMGFQPEVLSLHQAMRPDKQVALISATMPPPVEQLAKGMMSSCVKIVAGREGGAARSVEQRPVVFSDESRKLAWLLENIHKLIRWDRQVLIFCKSHGRVMDLSAVINDVLRDALNLAPQCPTGAEDVDNNPRGKVVAAAMTPAAARLSQGLSDTVSSRNDMIENGAESQPGVVMSGPTREEASKVFCRHLFGEMNQGERAAVLSAFRKKKFLVLVASDVASRGVDVPNVSTVVNYDTPDNIECFIHRVGRTGRGGATGVAYSLLTRKDAKIAGFVVETMENNGDSVPKQVLQLAMSDDRFKQARLAGRSFISCLRERQDCKKGGRSSKALHQGRSRNGPDSDATGLGYGSGGPSGACGRDTHPPYGLVQRFVQENATSAQAVESSSLSSTSGSDNGEKRRWDTSVSQPLPVPAGVTPNLPVSSPVITDYSSAQNDHIGRRAGVVQEGAQRPACAPKRKVFCPTDDISSSGSETEADSTTVVSTPSLLRPRASRQLQAAALAARARATLAGVCPPAPTPPVEGPEARGLAPKRSRWS